MEAARNRKVALFLCGELHPGRVFVHALSLRGARDECVDDLISVCVARRDWSIVDGRCWRSVLDDDMYENDMYCIPTVAAMRVYVICAFAKIR